MVEYGVRMLLSEFSNIYVFSSRALVRNSENQQKESDLSIFNGKIRFPVN